MKVPPVRLGAFIAYFPAWLKFHELFRLGAYGHPYDFISANYTKDLEVSQSYLVKGNNWEEEFKELKDFEEQPCAFLTPAMQDGSALGGPFLPDNGFSLSQIHEMMHLGSIWSIGLPTMPARLPVKHAGDKERCCYAAIAFPDHWKHDLPDAFISEDSLSDPEFCTMSKVVLPLGDTVPIMSMDMHDRLDSNQGIVHIGAKIGASVTLVGQPISLPRAMSYFAQHSRATQHVRH